MSRRRVEAPTLEVLENDPTSDSVERHPAYAMIGASRFTSGGSFPLFGSDFGHRNGIAITIHLAEMHRSLSSDWPFARKEVVEVHLSEAQWATFVSTLNVGDGVPCTLRHLNGVETPDIPEPPRRKEQFQNEMRDRLAEAVKTLAELDKLVEDGKKVPLRAAVRSLKQQLESSLPFVADQFNEHMEGVTESAKVEVGAYLTNAVTRAGLKSLGAADFPLLQLDAEAKKEGGS